MKKSIGVTCVLAAVCCFLSFACNDAIDSDLPDTEGADAAIDGGGDGKDAAVKDAGQPQEDGGHDGGLPDSNDLDATFSDTHPDTGNDAGSDDTGIGPDGGQGDAGWADVGQGDAGRPDSGSSDSGTLVDAGCTKNCTNRVCGPDGCGGTCAPGCLPGSDCNDSSGQCEVCETGTDGHDAAFVAQDVPASMYAGQSYPVSVTMQNSGTVGWTWDISPHQLGSQNPPNNFTWGTHRTGLTWGETIAPGASKTFNFTATAPAAPGQYAFQWRMVHELWGWFGASTPAVTVSVSLPAQAIDRAKHVVQRVPAAMKAGRTYPVSVAMMNTGTTTWTRQAPVFQLGSQSPSGNTVWGPARVDLDQGESIPPGSTKIFSFDVVAPGVPGSYAFQWQMVRAGVGSFGDSTANRTISVVDSDYVDLHIKAMRAIPGPYAWGTGIAVGNVTADAGNELVLGGGSDYNVPPVSGKLFAFDSSGRIVWTYTPPCGRYVGGVGTGDVDGDGRDEVAVGSFPFGEPGACELLDHNGRTLWTFPFPAEENMVRIAAIADVTPDPGKEVLFGGGYQYGELALLSATGRLIWKTSPCTDCPSCPIDPSCTPGRTKAQQARIADVNADGKNEIVVIAQMLPWPTLHNLRVLDGAGTRIWRLFVGEDATGLGVGDITPDPGLEIIVTSGAWKGQAGVGGVSLVRSTGSVLWEIPFDVPVWSAATGDVNGDGNEEILIGYGTHRGEVTDPARESGGIAVLDRNGQVIGDVVLPSSVKFMEVGDADNDGHAEILASCDAGGAFVVAF